MKRFFSFIAALTILFTVGCDKILESTSLYDKVENIEERLLRLEELCNKMNTNISSLQTIVTALQQNDYVTNIAPITQNGTEVGYTITFSKSGSITIYHGKDGKDGSDGKNGADGKDGKDGTTPVIGIKQDADGVYYWTLNGEWLLNERGEKVKAVATDGKDGANGEDGTDGTNGADGKDGKDGITPQLKIEDGYWYISYDNGNSWTQVGKATGEDGQDGSTSVIESIFKEIKQDENSIYLTLVDGTVISIPKTSSYLFDKLQSVSYIPRYTDGKATVFYSSISSSSTEMDFEVSPKDAVADIIAGWQECLSLKAVNTITRTVKYIDMPILSCQADTKCGIITISASGCNLSEAFFSGAEGVSARLGISDGNTNITSDFVELVAVKQSVSDRQICYTSTDEKIVEPYDKSVFGANIVSNTYEDGVGVILFDDVVTKIGDNAFLNCQRLKSVTIPNGVTEIGSAPFSCCANLAEFNGKFATADKRAIIANNVFCAYAIRCESTEYSVPMGVTKIGDSAFIYGYWLEKVVIPQGVTEIGEYAFCACNNLQSISIPNSVTTIGFQAFFYCNNNLKSITIPESVTTMGDSVFLDCSVLESVYCKATTPPVATYTYSSPSWAAFANNAENRKIYVPAASVAAYKAADGWKEYADAIVGYDFEGDNIEDSTEIPNNQIWYTSTDGNIVTPHKAEAFGAIILSNTYENGKGIILLNGVVTAIKDFAFLNCKNLANITLPNSLTEIGEKSFGACQNLTNIIIPDSVTSIGTNAFLFCTSLTSITIPNRVTYIQPNTFRCCEGLINVVIPESVTSIGSNAFFGCISLTNITIPNGVTTIQTGAFAGCKRLKNITIPESVTRIGEQAFLECNLKNVTIPESVTSLGYMAFGGCSVLESVYCKATTPPVATYSSPSWGAFANNAENRKIYVPAASVDTYKAADGWKEYADAIVGYDFEGDNIEDSTEIPNNQIWYTSTDGNIVTPYKAEAFGAIILSNTYENGRGVITFDRDLIKLGDHSFDNCDNLTTITLPNSITGIGYSAFYDCDRLTSIGFPNSLTKIEEHAFEYCSKLDNITLPNSLVSIGNRAFQHCESLSNITLSNGVTSIGDYAFGYCIHLASITIPDSVTTLGSDVFYYCIGLTSIVIPQNVSKIDNGTFLYCSNLTNVTIPDSVTHIYTSAFSNCSSLTNITIPDSVTYIGGRAFESCSALESVTIGSKVSAIGDGAFRYCYALKNLYCKPTVPPQIYEETLFGCQATICVPKSEGDVIANSYKSADYWKDFATYITSFEF